MINYTDDFKREVREVYGNTLDKYLETNNAFLGRILDDSCSDNISIDIVLKAKSLDEIQAKALKEKAKRDVYDRYWDQPGIRRV